MLKIEDKDFRSLNDFPLKWRWTDERWNKLPENALNTIQPFTDEKARELLKYSLEFGDYKGLSASSFENVSRIDASGDPAQIKYWLQNQFSDKNQDVIVSWNDHHAVSVRLDVFCKYWNDFCYPASDDLIVWGFEEDWVLMYLHDEEFIFGKKRRK